MIAYIYKIFAMIVAYVRLGLVLHTSSNHRATSEEYQRAVRMLFHIARAPLQRRTNDYDARETERAKQKKVITTKKTTANCLDCDVASVLATLH